MPKVERLITLAIFLRPINLKVNTRSETPLYPVIYSFALRAPLSFVICPSRASPFEYNSSLCCLFVLPSKYRSSLALIQGTVEGCWQGLRILHDDEEPYRETRFGVLLLPNRPRRPRQAVKGTVCHLVLCIRWGSSRGRREHLFSPLAAAGVLV